MIHCQLHLYYFWHKNILTWGMYCHVVIAKPCYIFKKKNLFKLWFFSLLIQTLFGQTKPLSFPLPTPNLFHSVILFFKSFHWLLLMHHMRLNLLVLDFKANICTPSSVLLIPLDQSTNCQLPHHLCSPFLVSFCFSCMWAEQLCDKPSSYQGSTNDLFLSKCPRIISCVPL